MFLRDNIDFIGLCTIVPDFHVLALLCTTLFFKVQLTLLGALLYIEGP